MEEYFGKGIDFFKMSVAQSHRELGIEVVYEERALYRPAIYLEEYLYGKRTYQSLLRIFEIKQG